MYRYIVCIYVKWSSTLTVPGRGSQGARPWEGEGQRKGKVAREGPREGQGARQGKEGQRQGAKGDGDYSHLTVI